jgi:hypothetical protein
MSRRCTTTPTVALIGGLTLVALFAISAPGGVEHVSSSASASAPAWDGIYYVQQDVEHAFTASHTLTRTGDLTGEVTAILTPTSYARLSPNGPDSSVVAAYSGITWPSGIGGTRTRQMAAQNENFIYSVGGVYAYVIKMLWAIQGVPGFSEPIVEHEGSIYTVINPNCN